MNTHTPRAQQHRQVQSLAVLAMFTAILFLLTFTPIGMIDLPIIKATVLHVPVIIGALLLGPKKGAFLGGMFGLASLLKNTLVPNLSSFAFSPLIPVPGLDRGSPWALVVCFVPRILVGVTPWLVYTLLQALSRRRGSVLQAGSMALSAVVGAFTNTALVMGLIALLFRDAYAAAQGIPAEAVLGFILGIVAANGVPEAIVAAILVMDAAVCAARMRTLLAEEGAAPQDVEGAVLSSVVPSLTQVAVQAAEALTRRPVRVLGRDLDPGLPTGDYDASNLGMDRLVDCVAALARWRPPLAVFDMGTATTLSVVDREGVFRGGMILPGLRLSVDALSARAAQLPCITFTQPEGLLGTDTVSCMRSGALYGAAAALEGISLRLEEELGPVTVVLTGGHGRDILPLLRRAVEYEPHLQLMGLRELWLRSL